MKRILTLKETIPSSSHNAPFSAELGEHWPAGTRFRLMGARETRYWQSKHYELKECRFLVQVGGEEVVLAMKEAQFAKVF